MATSHSSLHLNSSYRSILLLGPPGAGKGTMGKILGQLGNHVHLSSGDIFRGLSPLSPSGKLYHTYASKGHLLPDEVTVEIFCNFVRGLIATNRYFPEEQLLLLDGIPRTVKQAEFLQSHVKIVHIIVLNIEDPQILFKRIHKRAFLEKRMDDKNEETLRKRFEVYQKETAQVLNYYPSSLISSFNADQKPVQVISDILNSISYLL